MLVVGGAIRAEVLTSGRASPAGSNRASLNSDGAQCSFSRFSYKRPAAPADATKPHPHTGCGDLLDAFRHPSDAHDLRFGQPRAIGRQAGLGTDKYTMRLIALANKLQIRWR